MLSRRTKFFALVAPLTAALILGAAVSSSAAAAPTDCLDVDPSQLAPAVAASRVIVIGTVHEENGGGVVRIEPSAFLLGAASNEPIRPQWPNPLPDCALAKLSEGQRILAFLPASEGVLQWPSAGRVFWLDGGHATSAGATPETVTELELTEKIKAITGQYAFPAASEGESAGINWKQTVIPLGAVIAVLFAIGLVLMRVWHRIDPS